jgi:hypothetical protein
VSSTAQISGSEIGLSNIAHTSTGSQPARVDSPAIQHSGSPATSIPNIATKAVQHGEKDTRYVILGVTTGEDLRLTQIDVQDYRDEHFFHELRVRYHQLRGILRYYFSIWDYSHCDFIKVCRVCLQ